MTEVQANATSDSGSRHTSCTVLHAYSSADSRLRGMRLTPLQLRLLCSDLPPFQHMQLKVFFFPLLFFSYVFEPCASLGVNLNPTIEKKTKPPKKLRGSLQFQLWLLHPTSVGEQPKRQCTSLLHDVVGTAFEVGNLTGE